MNFKTTKRSCEIKLAVAIESIAYCNIDSSWNWDCGCGSTVALAVTLVLVLELFLPIDFQDIVTTSHLYYSNLDDCLGTPDLSVKTV